MELADALERVSKPPDLEISNLVILSQREENVKIYCTEVTTGSL